MQFARYRMIHALTVSNLEGYGFSIILAAGGYFGIVQVKLRTPDKVTELKYDLTPGDWSKQDFVNFTSWDSIKYITKDGFELMISDDKTDGSIYF